MGATVGHNIQMGGRSVWWSWWLTNFGQWLAKKWSGMDEITVGYSDITDGNHGHGRVRGWSQNTAFGMRKHLRWWSAVSGWWWLENDQKVKKMLSGSASHRQQSRPWHKLGLFWNWRPWREEGVGVIGLVGGGSLAPKNGPKSGGNLGNKSHRWRPYRWWWWVWIDSWLRGKSRSYRSAGRRRGQETPRWRAKVVVAQGV